MTSFGFGLSEIINIPSVFNQNSTNSTFIEHAGRLNNAFKNSTLLLLLTIWLTH